MPRSEGQKELGGLARSIDALFSAERSAPASGESGKPTSSAGGPDTASPAEDVYTEASSSLGAELAVDAEPAWEAPPSLSAGPELVEPEVTILEAAPAFADTEITEVWGEAEPVQTPAFVASDVITEREISQPTSPDAAGPDPEELAAAVEAFLSGSVGAVDDVKARAEELKERLALDPLADAVHRLASAAGDPPDEGTMELARCVANPAVASRLVQRMGHEHDEERLADYMLLSERLGRVMVNAFRGALTGTTDEHARRVYFDALIGMGDASRPVIEEMVEDDNRFLVRNAVAILGEIGGPRAVELVTSTLANTDSRVRREALLSLAKLGDEEAGQLVVGFMDDPDENVRVAAAVAAGELKVQRALRPVLGMLADAKEDEVCVSLLKALGQIGDPGAVQAIEKQAVGGLFSKPRTEVRVAAYRALYEIGTPHARELLQQARTDKDRGVQIAIRELLKDR
jgi:HEAT repeats